MSGRTSKVRGAAKLEAILRRERAKGRRVVWTNGTFDLLHVGHVRFLRVAKALGDLLVVGLNSDASVKKYKGVLRPIIPARQRAEVLSELACVDHIVMFSGVSAASLIRRMKPEVFVKGSGFSNGQRAEASEARKCGSRIVVTAPCARQVSDTKIVERIVGRYKKGRSRRSAAPDEMIRLGVNRKELAAAVEAEFSPAPSGHERVLAFLRKKFKTKRKVYASDVAIGLDLDYETVRLILNRLENEKKIRVAKA